MTLTTDSAIRFFVSGHPSPGGSKKAFPFRRKNGSLGVAVSDAGGERTKHWRTAVRDAGMEHMRDRAPLDEPLDVRITFLMPRPRAHFGTGKKSQTLRRDAPFWHSKAPDVLKLARSTEDALSGCVWRDDCLIARETIEKQFTDTQPGALIEIAPLTDSRTRAESAESAALASAGEHHDTEKET